VITAVINTLNEEHRISPCLESIEGLAEEIIVVDMHSDDKTRRIAEQFGARIILHERVKDCPDMAKRPGIEAAHNDWVLMLDADERVPPDLGRELKRIASENRYAGVIMARKNVTFGRWLKHGGWWRVDQVKMFRKDKVIWGWEQFAHRQVEVEGELCLLPRSEALSLVHENFEHPWDYAERALFRYARFEARLMYEKGVRFSLPKLLWKPVRKFIGNYVLRGGFLDGIPGFLMNALFAGHEFMLWANLWSIHRSRSGSKG